MQLARDRRADAARRAGDERAQAAEVIHGRTLPRAATRHVAPRLWTANHEPVYERDMRNMLIALLVAVLAVACGPSAELKAAKTAHYKGDKAAMFNIVKETTAAKYNLQKA